jgi:hypothetical protein
MSLINDALKRAKDAQQKSPATAPGPQLRPIEPAPSAGHGLNITVLLVLIVVGFSAICFLSAHQKNAEKPQPVAAKSAPVMDPIPTQPPVRTVTSSATATIVTNSPVPEKHVTPMPAPVVAAPVQPIKLQAIFYNPGHASAIISGKTVHAGDTVKGFRVVAISSSSATLVSATQTNVMTLEEQ